MMHEYALSASRVRAPSGAGRDSLFVCIFAASIFYGDVFLGFTIPVAIFALVVVMVIRAAAWRNVLQVLPAGLAFLGCLALVVGVQAWLGFGPRGKSDLVVYLPLAYAGLTMVALAGSRLSDRQLYGALVAGGLIAAVALVWMLLFVAKDSYVVPGQNPEVTQQRQAEVRAVLQESQPVPESALPEFKVSRGMEMYYAIKNRARTPLGMSNFLAAVFVFLLNVTLYQRSRLAFLFAALVLVTSSRTGFGFVLISIGMWMAAQDRRHRTVVLAAAGVCALAVIGWLVSGRSVATLPGMESLGARAWYMTTAFDPILQHPLVGAPRSETIRLFGYPITWTPHNSLLHLTVLFGVVGLAAYLAYAWVAVGAIRRRAVQSDLWRGISVGISLLFIWSLMEFIVLQPSFEILVAALYSLARSSAARA